MPRKLNLCFTKVKSLSSSPPSPKHLTLDSAATYDESAIAAAIDPDFATAFASQRFFFSSPGRSNSIIDSSSLSSSTGSISLSSPENPPKQHALFAGSIAITTYSPDPFMDFRRSMEEMVEALDLVDVRANWDCLHELVLFYLSLNPKSTHKFIIGAFADLVISLMGLPA